MHSSKIRDIKESNIDFSISLGPVQHKGLNHN